MASVRITELPILNALSANNANTVFVAVDKTTNTTSQFSTTTLAGGLFANNILNVGTSTPSTFPGILGQFIGNTAPYSQVNFQNANSAGSMDIVLTADTGDNSNNFVDLGINNSNFTDPTYSSMKQKDGYLFVNGSSASDYVGNLVIGTTAAHTNVIFAVGGTTALDIVGKISSSGLALNSGRTLTFGDGSVQSTAGIENTAVVHLNALTLSGNLIANSVGQGIFVDTFTSNNATFSKNAQVLGSLIVNGTITANTLLGNVYFSNVTTVTTQANSIQWFAQTSSPAQTSGQVWYSSNTISLVQDTDVAGDRPSISKVLFERVYNGTGSAIPNNSWVRLGGAVTSNSVPYIQLADATSAANSQIEGFIKVGIAAGGYGFLYTRGIVSDLDASSFGNNGQLLFLSTTPGQASNVAPTGANSVVQVAKILSNGSANGKLQVSVSNLQAYGKPNGAILFANNNLIQASNTLFINESIGQLNVSSTLYAANGIINRTSQYPSTQTAITISMTSDTWVKCNVGASLTITPTAFTPGSEVVVIATNPNSGAGAARTITHGAAAVNSSVGATSFTLGATTTAFIKYYCFDGDLANTYVQVTYS
jgi:hypothetical protein